MSARRSVAPALAIAIQNAAGGAAVPKAERIRAWIAAAVGEMLRGELTVRLVGEAESAELNRRYRGREGATNVLAFPAERAAPAPTAHEEPLPAGDLAVCAAVVAREAAEQHKAPEAHWAHVLIHGALHLAGYDHETPRQARAMETRERLILADLGFPDPY